MGENWLGLCGKWVVNVNYSFVVLPVVSAELAFLAESGNPREKKLAGHAFESYLTEWRFTPRELTDLEEDYAEEEAENLLRLQLLPATEFHDALLIAEAAVVSIPCLLSNDAHLKDCDQEHVQIVLRARDLRNVIIFRYQAYLRTYSEGR